MESDGGTGGGLSRLFLGGIFGGSPQTPPGPPRYEESTAEFSFVERLLPPSRIPEPPAHPKYPTPSGWSPPAGQRPPGAVINGDN